MSTRRNKVSEADKQIAKLRSELDDLKAQAKAADAADVASHNVHSHEFDQLTPVEQSAASLGVNPTAWKPISFLNNAHYEQLIKANMLDDNLARRIEVCALLRKECFTRTYFHARLLTGIQDGGHLGAVSIDFVWQVFLGLDRWWHGVWEPVVGERESRTCVCEPLCALRPQLAHFISRNLDVLSKN